MPSKDREEEGGTKPDIQKKAKLLLE